jgi:cell division protein FtsQ
MMPKARLRPPRRRFALLGGKRNRRVRLGGGAPSRGLFERLGARAQRSGRNLLFGALVLGGAGALFGVHQFFTRSSHFAIRTLRFSPTAHVTAESLAARAGVVVGANLFKLDLDQLARDVAQEPWVQSAHARRELPSTIAVDVVERAPAAIVALGPLYLADGSGAVFKRANPDEAAALPVVTGIDRERYLADPDGARAEVRAVLAALDAWRARAGRPAVGEAHLDKLLGVTLYLSDGVGVRLGAVDDSLPERLRRFDAVWSALESSGERARFIHLDNRARPDRITVKLKTALHESEDT